LKKNKPDLNLTRSSNNSYEHSSVLEKDMNYRLSDFDNGCVIKDCCYEDDEVKLNNLNIVDEHYIKRK
jgi:hypothetical protein